MCMQSPVGRLTQQTATTAAPMSATPSMSVMQLKQYFSFTREERQALNLPEIILIDIREADEIKEANEFGDDTIHIAMGALIRDAKREKFPDLKGKKTLIACNSGHRGKMTTDALNEIGWDARNLIGGVQGWIDKKQTELAAARNFDFCVVLGYPIENHEQLTMATQLATASQKNGNDTCLVLMSDAVMAALPGKIDSIHIGEPFKPVSKLIQIFVAFGGMIFVCRSCCKLRKIDVSRDLKKFVYPCSGPDVIGWNKTSQGSMNFS